MISLPELIDTTLWKDIVDKQQMQMSHDQQRKQPHCLKSIWKKLSFCPPEVNCGSPITRSDDWSHKGGHKQIFRRAPRGRGWDGGRQKGKENQNHFWPNLSKLWCCIIVKIQDELDSSEISSSSLSVAWLSSDLTRVIVKSWSIEAPSWSWDIHSGGLY